MNVVNDLDTFPNFQTKFQKRVFLELLKIFLSGMPWRRSDPNPLLIMENGSNKSQVNDFNNAYFF
jgi:hypothetical protein